MVRPKKYLGQHFLINQGVANKIVDSLEVHSGQNVVEVGPGTGVLTDLLVNRGINLKVIELDHEAVEFLKLKPYAGEVEIIHGDFLKISIDRIFEDKFAIIGNFPYNISSQILFKILDNRDKITQVVGMVQKEVAQRIAAGPGSKTYGILSVLLQAYYSIELKFHVKPGSFHPPPNVDSSVLRLTRNETDSLDCDEKLFFELVKTGFQNRRKTLRNALKRINLPDSVKSQQLLDLRAEALSVGDYVNLAKKISLEWNP